MNNPFQRSSRGNEALIEWELRIRSAEFNRSLLTPAATNL